MTTLCARNIDRGSRSTNQHTVLEIKEIDMLTLQRPHILHFLSCVIDRVVERNEIHIAVNGASMSPPKLTLYHGLQAPTISIDNYLERIFRYANCSPSCFVVAYAYIDRLLQKQPGMMITNFNVHRLLITGIMVAVKFLDDRHYNNAYFAKIGGVTTLEMNRLELDFLFCLDFRLQVTADTFEYYYCHLEREGFCWYNLNVERLPQPDGAIDETSKSR